MTDTKKREKARQAPTYSHVGETGHFNFSPAGFRRWANQFYQCRQSFQCPDFSPVPYFLLCRCLTNPRKGTGTLSEIACDGRFTSRSCRGDDFAPRLHG